MRLSAQQNESYSVLVKMNYENWVSTVRKQFEKEKKNKENMQLRVQCWGGITF